MNCFEDACEFAVADPRGGWGAYARTLSAVFFNYYYNSEVYEQKNSIERVRNWSQNRWNGHFRDSIFQQFLEDIAPDSPTY